MYGYLRYLFIVLAVPLFLGLQDGPSYAAPYYKELPSYLLMDLDTGEMLLSNGINERRAPASLTKIMTAIIALEYGNIDEIVTVSRNARRARGHRLLLSEGEQIELGKLITATLINSGNDGARAIAEHIGGNIDGFSDMMNAKAVEIGMSNTHFVNPSGMPNDDHYSTAEDLAILAAYALKNKSFRKIVSTREVYFPVFGSREDLSFKSTNKLLDEYPLCDGVKTGFTDLARYCLVASATYKDHKLLAVVLGAERNCQWSAARELLEWGFGLIDPEYSVYATYIDTEY